MAEHTSDPPNLPPQALDALRKRIDEIDQRLVSILCERARIVVEIGRTKQTTGGPIYVPHREREVIARAVERNPGPLDDRTIEAIYRELMSGSFKLELPLRVGYLGPPGSFSHLAAARHFGSSVELADLHEIDGVFEEVERGRCHYGLVPYENSIGGGVTDTMDAFRTRDVRVYAEALIDVAHTLLANGSLSEIEVVYSKPQVFSQCRRFLGSQLSHARQVPETSSSAAVQRAAREPRAAAIGSELAGEMYDVKPVAHHIEDNPNNITRFLVLGPEAARPSGDDKTTIMFTTSDKPGALVDVLAVFREAGINLSHIDKRPSGRENWEYTFFIDCEGHAEDASVRTAVEEAATHCRALKVLGSYPRAQRVL